MIGKVETQASVTASASDQFLIASGLEQAALVDHDVEIAEKYVRGEFDEGMRG